MSNSVRPYGLQSAKVPLSMGFSRHECWSGLPCPPLRDLPNPGVKFKSLMSPALAGGFLITVPPGKHVYLIEIRAEWSMSLNENTSKAE